MERKPADGAWTPTENPNATVVPGKMRSDREEVPDGFSKSDADKAETMEAKLDQGTAAFAAPGCQVYWPAPYEVCGAIKDKYNELGGPSSFLLYPTTNELTQPDGIGKRTVFQNGPIFWSPWGGAHPVANHFYACWQRNGWEGGVLGYPTSDEIVNSDGLGRRQYFDGGTIYWKLNEAYFVGGAIRDKWGETGWEGGWLGYPTSDETLLPDGQGRMNKFEHGRIYWSPSTGAHPVAGQVEIEWGSEQYESGRYGYPISDENATARADSREQDFQQGTIRVPNPLTGGDDADEDAVTEPGPGGTDYAPDASWRTGLSPRSGSSQWNRCRDATVPDTGDVFLCSGPGYTDTPSAIAPEPPRTLNDPISLKPGCDKDYASKRAEGLAGDDLSTPYWQVDRLYACGVNPNTIVVRNQQGTITGTASGKLEQELITRGDTRSTQYRVRFTVEKMSATAISVTGNLTCSAPTCSVTVHDEIVNEPLTVGASIFGYYEFGPGVLSPGQTLMLINYAELQFSTPGGHETFPGSGKTSAISPDIRCDDDQGIPGISAGLPSQGCVFPDRDAVMDFASDPNLSTIADHVRRAQQSGLGGAPRLYYTGPLTRMTDFTERERNGNRACPSGRYSVAGFSCDEYPFRSTNQGAAQPPGVVLPPNGRTFAGCQISDPPRVEPSRTGLSGYSVCMVPTTPVDANGEQAKVIARFYYYNRIRDGEQFYVRADPAM